MDNEKVYTPEVIESNPFPMQENVVSFDVAQQANQTTGMYGPATTKEQLVPTKKVAVELLSSKLNTRTRKILGAFQFTPSGAIQIGNYQEGDFGDIRISPVQGIVPDFRPSRLMGNPETQYSPVRFKQDPSYPEP